MTKKLSKKYFFYHGDITEGIFDSQVMHHINMMRNYGHTITLICFIPLIFYIRKYKITREKLEKIKENNISCAWVPVLSASKMQGKILNIFYVVMFYARFKYFNMKNYCIIIHARAPLSAVFAIRLKKLGIVCRVIFDMRADGASESRFLEQGKTDLQADHAIVSNTLIDKMQSKALRGSDICLFVSNALKNIMTERYKFTPHYHIIPSAARSELFSYDPDIREEMRDMLGLKDKFVVGYSGSMHAWQRVDKALEMYTFIAAQRQNTCLVIYTKETSVAESICKQHACNNSVLIKSIDYKELGRYIQCMDVGVILRDKLMLNKVASPTKFAEYILCGVPVFASTGVGDLEEMITQNSLGVCIEDFNDVTEFKNKIQLFLDTRFDREQIAQYGRNKFSREAYIEVYNKIYKNE